MLHLGFQNILLVPSINSDLVKILFKLRSISFSTHGIQLLVFDSKKNSFGSIRKIKRVEFKFDIELELLNELNSSFNTFGSSLSNLIRAHLNK